MSAYLCGDNHFHYLAATYVELTNNRYGPVRVGGAATKDRAVSVIAGILKRENLRSINARYPGRTDRLIGDSPTEAYEAIVWVDGPGEEMAPAVTVRMRAMKFQRMFLTIGTKWIPALFKALDCYEYQACEHVGYQTSLAKRIVDYTRKATARHVAGYDEAEYGVPSRVFG